MPRNLQKNGLVVLGMGGTIAGTGPAGGGAVGYTAGQIGVEGLLEGLSLPFEYTLRKDNVCTIDSKDIDEQHWYLLQQKSQHYLEQKAVQGLVITHGTDTVEETAWFLQSVLPAGKPVVITCAMRPATALSADGPTNLRDALCFAASTTAQQLAVAGQAVTVVVDGAVHSAEHVQKMRPYGLQAFSSGAYAPLAWVEEGRVRLAQPLMLQGLPKETNSYSKGRACTPPPWPWVEVVHSHAAARPAVVDALTAAGVQGLVVAGTGNGTVHSALEQALERARAAGVRVWRCTRCPLGAVVQSPDEGCDEEVSSLSPWKARISLMLALSASSP